MNWIMKGIISAAMLVGAATSASASRFVASFTGVAPSGWQDTTGLLGTPGADYSGVGFTGSITYDLAEYQSSGGTFPQFDASGAPTPGFTINILFGGVPVPGQNDVSSYFGPYILPFSGIAGIYAGAWNGNFYFEANLTPAFTTQLGVTQADVDSGLFRPFVAGSGDLDDAFIQLDNGAGGNLPSLQLSTLTLAAVPEPASWGMMLTGFGLIGLTVRRRRALPVAA